MTKTRIIAVLVGAVALILVILALQLLAPGDRITATGPGDARIDFSIDHNLVFSRSSCVTLRWQVEHIQAVYFEGQPTIGEGFQNLCTYASTQPQLHVVFDDNTTAEYTLQIRILVEQPSTWFLASAAVLLLLVSLYVAVSRPSTAASESPRQPTPRIVLLFAGIGLLISLVVAFAVVMELALRLYFGNFGTLDDKIAYLYSRDQIEAVKSDRMPLPFVEYGLRPDYAGHNALGYRGDEVQVPKPDGVYRIVTLGDSATYGALVPYNETYSYALQEILRDDYGYSQVEVVNGGVTGYASWNMLVDLAFRIPVLQPDLVIVYQGWNDLEARERSPDCYSDPSPFLGLDPRRDLRVQPTELSPSVLYRFLAINFGWMQNPGEESIPMVNSEIGCSAQDLSEIAENIAANPPIYFERNTREMIGIARTLGFRIMLMTWAYDVNSDQMRPYRVPAIAEHNAITARIAEENDVLFLDYAAVAPSDESDWRDTAHMSAQGNRSFAQTIARYLVDQQVIPAPPG